MKTAIVIGQNDLDRFGRDTNVGNLEENVDVSVGLGQAKVGSNGHGGGVVVVVVVVPLQ